MRSLKVILLALVVFLNSILISGCWNYKEIDKVAIVLGVAIDKGFDERIRMTVEVVNFTGERDTKAVSKIFGIEGETIFDAARNQISISGKRLYWSHAKVVILGEEIAKEGIVHVLDWFSRDSETRPDVNVLISSREPAKDILLEVGTVEVLKSLEIRDILKNQKSLSKAPQVQIWQMINEMKAKGRAAIAPEIKLKKTNGQKGVIVEGTAVFKEDKLICFIDGEETRDMLFIRDEIKGGVLVQEEYGEGDVTPVSLEIFKNKTKVKPVINNDRIEFNITTKTNTAIDEIQGTLNIIEDEGRNKLEQHAAEKLKGRMEKLIKKMQNHYEADIFGFGAIVREEYPKVWERVEDNWEEEFKEVSVSVITNIHIQNSARLSKPLEIGE